MKAICPCSPDVGDCPRCYIGKHKITSKKTKKVKKMKSIKRKSRNN